MKKTLAILMVAIIAAGMLFAGIEFSGAFTFGYEMAFDDGFSIAPYGSDKKNTLPASFAIVGADEDGIFSVTLKNMGNDGDKDHAALLDEDGTIDAYATVDLSKALSKAYDLDLPVSLKVSGGRLSEQAGNRAEVNASGKNWARVRTNDLEAGIAAEVGYEKIVKVFVAGDPVTHFQAGAKDPQDGTTISTNGRHDFIANVLVTPVDGVSVAGAYARVADGSLDGAFNVGAKVDVQKLADLDFSLVASATYKYSIAEERSTIDASAKFGMDKFTVGADYAIDFGGKTNGKDNDTVNKLYLGVDTSIVENVALGAYVITTDLGNFGDCFEIGATAGYAMGNIDLGLRVGYVEGNETKKYLKSEGFVIQPFFSVGF